MDGLERMLKGITCLRAVLSSVLMLRVLGSRPRVCIPPTRVLCDARSKCVLSFMIRLRVFDATFGTVCYYSLANVRY